MFALVVTVLTSVTTSFLCSLMEAVILSVPAATIIVLGKEGKRSGRLLLKLHSNIDRPIAAILTLNTVSNTIGAMLVGHYVNSVFGEGRLAVATGLLTIALLVFSEIIPKSLGARHAKRLAPLAGYIITGMVYLTLPLVGLSQMMIRLFSTKTLKRTSRAEMLATAELGATEGVIHQKEKTIIENLLELDTIKVSEIMTPRSVVNAFEMHETVGSIMDKYKPVRFSRIPVYDRDIDHVTGLLHRYKLMEAVSHERYDTKLKDITNPIFTVQSDLSVSAALDLFIKRREHLFLVVDEYGVMCGIVTLEDAIETLLGVEIVDYYESVTDMRQYALEQWRLKKQALLKKP